MQLNTIYNENCLDTMAKMPNEFIDLVVTSPPYDNLRDYKGYSFEFEKIAGELARVLKVGGVIVWVVNDATINGTESGTSFRQALYFKEIGLNLHDTMIYNRDAQLVYKNKYSQDFEYMFVFSKSKPKTVNLTHQDCKPHGGNKSGTRKKNGTIEYRIINRNKTKPHSNIWKYNRGNNHHTKDKIAFKHPAIFPEQLVADHIKSWTNEGDVVYDCFMGSGTTAKMAKSLNRHYIGSEISKEYCDIAKHRLETSWS